MDSNWLFFKVNRKENKKANRKANSDVSLWLRGAAESDGYWHLKIRII
ncbi:hypothetical protein [Pectobacterium versatile]|jgi:hypothetical protein|nr:hypothetical protein [Pectobacterium versatile]